MKEKFSADRGGGLSAERDQLTLVEEHACMAKFSTTALRQ